MTDTPAPAAPSTPSAPATPAASSAPTPASTPSSTPPTPASEPTPAVEETVSFEGLGTDFDDGVDPLTEPETPLAPETPPAQPSTPAAPAPAASAPPAPVPGAEGQPPVTPPGPKEPAAAQPPASSPSEPAPKSLVEMVSEKRSELIDDLAKNQFAFAPEDVKRITESLDTDANAFIVSEMPRLKAEVYYEAVKASLNHINNMVPRMVMQVVKAMKQHDEAETAFYGKFPTLDKTKHGADVVHFSRLLKQANPQITQDDLLATVAAAIMAKHGLVGQATAPVAPNGASRPPSPPPFVPARPGTTVVKTPEPESPWAGLGAEHDDEG